jgi:hypothetical protein
MFAQIPDFICKSCRQKCDIAAIFRARVKLKFLQGPKDDNSTSGCYAREADPDLASVVSVLRPRIWDLFGILVAPGEVRKCMGSGRENRWNIVDLPSYACER